MSTVGVFRFQGPTTYDKIVAAYEEGKEKKELLTNFSYVVYKDIVDEWKTFVSDNRKHLVWLNEFVSQPIDRKSLMLLLSEQDKETHPNVNIELSTGDYLVRISWTLGNSSNYRLDRTVHIETFVGGEESFSSVITILGSLDRLLKLYTNAPEEVDENDFEDEGEQVVWMTKFE